LVEDGSDILVTLDPDARFVYVAPSWFRVLGYSADGLVGRPCVELVHEDDRARFGEFLQAIFAGEADPGIEFRTVHADGAMRWIGSRARLATGDDGQAVVIATWRDVTKRRRAEDESLLNQLRLQELLDLAQRASDLTDDEILELALVKSVRLTRSGRGILEVFGDDGERKAICWPDTNWNPSPFNGALSWGSDAREAGGSDADSSAAASDDEEPSNEAGVLRYITVPVIEDDRARMVIRVAGKPENYDETDIRLLTLLAGDVLRIVERGKAQQKLRLSAKVFDSTAEGVLVVDGEFRIAAVNRAFTQITGYLESELLGSDINVLRSGCQDDTFYRAIGNELERTGCWRGELMNRRKSGEIYPVWLTVSSLADEQGRFSHFVAVFSDITAIKQSEEKLDFLAHHDPLTALPNRLLFDKRLELALVRARRKSRKLAVLFMDLDRFKGVNDSLGHPVGDALLQSLAKEVRAVLRGEDMIARIGGDEFVVLLEDLAGISDAMHVLNRLTAVFAKPIRAGSHELYVTLSIGISVYPADGTEAYELVRNADAAMYLAKMEGRNTYRFYNPEITAQALERLRIETDLRKALNEGGLSLHFQPQIELESGRLLGAEVLARWTHEDLGAISPTRFIPVAEESGLIGMLGTFVLNCACRQLRRWRDAGFELPGISVNLSVAQIERQNVAAEVESALLASGLTGGDLELEITESVIMRHTDRAIDMLNQLRNLGVHLAIDDFGSGFSSLNYLKRLPIQTLKIDRSFINNIGQEANDEAIVRAVLALSANLNLRVVAEGVETEEQARFLQEAGCQDAQGFLYSKPLPADAFAARFQSWPLVARRSD
jgi:diguanylate cyclase (GGDEF)-like protein/PAS domain S-box-containing protein